MSGTGEDVRTNPKTGLRTTKFRSFDMQKRLDKVEAEDRFNGSYRVKKLFENPSIKIQVQVNKLNQITQRNIIGI